MLHKRRAGIMVISGLCLALLLSCGLGVGLVHTQLVALPRGTLSVGPIAIAAAQIRDQPCRPIWEPCALHGPQAQQRMVYAIWMVIQTGAQAQDFRHYSVHIPLRR